MSANGNLISVESVHGKSGDAFLAMSTAQLLTDYGKGGKERTSAALEIGRRKFNRAAKKSA